MIYQCVILTFIFLSQTASLVRQEHGIDWLSNRVVDLSELRVAGKENNSSLFVCRTQHNGGWIPGKSGIDDDGVFRCQIQYWQVGYNSTDFEVLVWPAETTSWVETKGSNIPNRPIVAGIDPGDGETTYVCRTWHNEQLVLGKALGDFSACLISYQGEPRIPEYEILVKNALGVYLLGE